MITWLIGVSLDPATWLWLRRRYRGLVAKRLEHGYLIVGTLAELEVNDYEQFADQNYGL